MSKDPLISVVINNYNYADYVGEAIQSVLNQDYPHVELIVVDDGSTDQSREVINRFDDGRMIRVYKENGGQASALNAGFREATGVYVAFLDADDLFDRDKLTRMLDAFRSGSYAVVQHRLRVIDGAGTVSDRLFPSLLQGELDVLPLYFRTRDTSFYSATSGIMVSRRVLRRIFPLPEADWKICADAPLTRPLALFGTVFTLESPAGSYRIHGHNNWMNTEEKRRQQTRIQYKINRYTNAFLRRWGRSEQIELPLPVDWMRKNNISSLALYGAGKHTRYLLEGQGLPEAIRAEVILDDSPAEEAIEQVPVKRAEEVDVSDLDAVLISSDAFEVDMIRRGMEMGWQRILPIYSVSQFRRQKAAAVSRLLNQLREKGKRRVALFGGGVHTLNLILSELWADDIEVACILDEQPTIKAMWGIPVVHPDSVDRSLFDAVVLSSDSYERQLFYKARDYGFGSIFLLYGAFSALRQNRADFEEIRRYAELESVKRIALYDPRWFTQTFLQGEYGNEVEVDCVLSSDAKADQWIFDLPVLGLDNALVRSFDLLVIPPRISESEMAELQRRFADKMLVLRSNPDEIELIRSFIVSIAQSRVMLDVGANLGLTLQPFAEMGWTIHAFEPDSIHRRNLTKRCASHSNVSICPFALSNKVEKNIPLYRSRVSSGISGLSVFHRSHYLSEYIETTLLSLYVEENEIKEADFLKIDTEGYDLFVLQGNDWSSFRPRVILCEFEDHKTIPLGYSFHDMAGFLVEQGYSVLVSEWEPIIEYGNQPRWRRFITYPCQLEDEIAFGNLIAVRDQDDFKALTDLVEPEKGCDEAHV